MGKAKGKSRIERKLVDKTVLPEPEPLDVWQPPDPEECEEASYPVDLVQGRDRYHVRQLMHRGRLVDFAFAQDRRHGESWRKVARIDCAHGTVHLHLFNQAGQEILLRHLRSISNQADVEEGYDQAADIIEQGWEEHVRRWASE